MDSISFTSCDFVSGGSHGLFVGTPAKRVKVIGGTANGNGAGPDVADSYGILFNAGATDFAIQGVNATNGLGAGTQAYGIVVGAVASCC